MQNLPNFTGSAIALVKTVPPVESVVMRCCAVYLAVSRQCVERGLCAGRRGVLDLLRRGACGGG